MAATLVPDGKPESAELSGSPRPGAAYDRYARWLRQLEQRDPKVHAELAQRHAARVAEATAGLQLESSEGQQRAAEAQRTVLETIVREGRPALAIRDDRIEFTGAVPDAASVEVLNRLKASAAAIEPFLHLVGRIDVENFPGSATYLGTGWLVAPNIVVTNRHVAAIVARADGGQYRFIPGRFGSNLQLSVNYRRERGVAASAAAPVLRVIWIEPDERKADFALLEVGLASDGRRRDHIPLASTDLPAGSNVVVVGYPARASADVIPDQAWMDRIYEGFYDVKRIAPGLTGPDSRGWATHDCTTLGGNSGSAVLDMKSGEAVALHFAGAYMIENYAVPASQIRRYLERQPWTRELSVNVNTAPARAADTASDTRPQAPSSSTPGAVTAGANDAARTISVTVPVTVTVSIGNPISAVATQDPPSGANISAHAAAPAAADAVEIAARELRASLSDASIVAVRAGYAIKNGTLSDEPALVVLVQPSLATAAASAVPSLFKGYRVLVRPASVADQLDALRGGEVTDMAEEAVTSIAYDDADRRGAGFSFGWIEESMDLTLHVGPERSWNVLSGFLQAARKELVSSMYEFHAKHIAQTVQKRLRDGTSMTLVLAAQSRDPKDDEIPDGDFDRSDTFTAWENGFGERFELVHVPVGSSGLVATSYHIKVTVRDREWVWLSSGNWKRSSQPLIDASDLDDPKITSRAGNREWHVVLRNKTLAERFRNHILADFEAAQELGGTPESAAEQIFVDVPRALLEGMQLEAAPERVLHELPIQRRVRVKPLLTPDRKGRIYTDAVVDLIESAEQQLVFQNQYIMMRGAKTGNLKQLVDALVRKSREIEDFRMILRSGSDTFWDDMTALKKRGLDVARCVKRLPKIHTKGIVVDGRRVLLGSHNWSALGVSLNRDASLIFDDREIAAYYLEAFDIDWQRASALDFESALTPEYPRLAEGDRPPDNFVRIPLSSYLEG